MLHIHTVFVFAIIWLIMFASVAHARWVCLTWRWTVWLRSCLGPLWWCHWSWWPSNTSLAVGIFRSFASCYSSLQLFPLGAIQDSPLQCCIVCTLLELKNNSFTLFIWCSLRVNLDMGKMVFSWMIKKDSKIPGTMVRTSTIPEQLGRISYLLTDKTG